MNLNINKATQDTGIPLRILKENADFLSNICVYVNNTINSSKFPASFQLANVSPVFKNGTRKLKDNNRPVSILPIISKYFRISSVSNCLTISKLLFRVFSAASEKVSVFNII